MHIQDDLTASCDGIALEVTEIKSAVQQSEVMYNNVMFVPVTLEYYYCRRIF